MQTNLLFQESAFILPNFSPNYLHNYRITRFLTSKQDFEEVQAYRCQLFMAKIRLKTESEQIET